MDVGYRQDSNGSHACSSLTYDSFQYPGDCQHEDNDAAGPLHIVQDLLREVQPEVRLASLHGLLLKLLNMVASGIRKLADARLGVRGHVGHVLAHLLAANLDLVACLVELLFDSSESHPRLRNVLLEAL